MSAAAGIQLRYKLQRENFTLDVDTEVPMQGITGIFGPSGAGKTTLLRCIAGLERSAGDSSPSIQDRNIGYVFQEPRLFDHLSVRGNIGYGQKRRGHNGGPDFDHVIDLLGLQQLLSRSPSELSGGEAQRVAIARALMSSPRFVLMDEPLASLDQARRDEILPFLDRLHVESQVPIIYVSHNIDEVCRLCDHLVVIDAGQVVAEGELQDVLVSTTVAGLGGDQAGSVIQGRADSYDSKDDLTLLTFSGGSFWVPGKAGASGAALRIRIRANDVSLCRVKPEQSTILNIVPAVIDRMPIAESASVLVRLMLGSERIVARVTQRSVRELDLKPGDKVFAQIKSVTVRATS
jgi:molybdate transport system ATP-binding protein